MPEHIKVRCVHCGWEGDVRIKREIGFAPDNILEFIDCKKCSRRYYKLENSAAYEAENELLEIL